MRRWSSVLIILLILTFTTSVKASERQGRFSFGLQVGYTTLKMDRFNEYVVEWYRGTLNMSDIDEINSALILSAHVDVRLMNSPTMFGQVSVQHMSRATDGTGGSDIGSNISVDLEVATTPILFTLFWAPTQNRPEIRFGLGVGYYPGRVDLDITETLFSGDGGPISRSYQWDEDTIGFHASALYLYQLTSRLTLDFEGTYRMANVTDLTDEDGELVQLYNPASDTEKPLDLDFTGLELSAGLSFHF